MGPGSDSSDRIEVPFIRMPEIIMELRRGSMREKWGVTIVYRWGAGGEGDARLGQGGALELGISKVAMFSPAAKVGGWEYSLISS